MSSPALIIIAFRLPEPHCLELHNMNLCSTATSFGIEYTVHISAFSILHSMCGIQSEKLHRLSQDNARRLYPTYERSMDEGGLCCDLSE